MFSVKDNFLEPFKSMKRLSQLFLLLKVFPFCSIMNQKLYTFFLFNNKQEYEEAEMKVATLMSLTSTWLTL